MSTINETVINYIAAWNETDAVRRREIIARTWTEDGSYLDAHREGTGHAALDAMIAAVQQRFAGYRFRLSSGVEMHQDRVRFSWIGRHTGGAALFRGHRLRGASGRRQDARGYRVYHAAPAAS